VLAEVPWLPGLKSPCYLGRVHKGKIIVSGILFWYPLAGVTYQFLHYLIALRRLGYDVYYIEDSGRWIYDPRINDISPDASGNVAAVVPTLESHGFSGKWAFRGNYPDGQCYGMNETQIETLYDEADAFLNVTASQEIREEHLRVKRRIYVESDPFAVQAKVATGDPYTIRQLEAHDTLFTFGENIGDPDCLIPAERFTWLPTRQPVVLDLWPVAEPRRAAPFNTFATWHNKGKNVEWRGETWYWTKDREFKKFLDLPKLRSRVGFELATNVDDDMRTLLTRQGWRIADGLSNSSTVESYRDYIRHSRGEFTVAKDQFVRSKSGWFSDRSASYLAAGRPVITQETGFSKFYGGGKGLFGFTTMDDILSAVDAIESDYAGNCLAAREIAAEYFAAEKVVKSLMERAGLA
jgi:hypothetical protein